MNMKKDSLVDDTPILHSPEDVAEIRVRGSIDHFEIKSYNLQPTGNGFLFSAVVRSYSRSRPASDKYYEASCLYLF